MRNRSLLFGVSFLWVTALVFADPITYDVTVNTSSISGTAGSLDLNFNPGPFATQSASLQILGFNSDGSLADTPSLTGDVAGTLPSTLTFDNGGGFNDYFTGFTYGSKLSFKVSFYGPALSAPDEVSTSGSAFSFSMFSDAAGTIPILTSDTVSGFAFTVNVNLDGTTTLANSSAQTTVLPATAATSEPTTAPLIALGIGLCSVFRLILCRHGLMFCRRIGRQFRHGV